MNAVSKIKGLYALCDASFSPQYSHGELARLLLQGGAPVLQLRMKDEKDLGKVEAVAEEILEEKKRHSFVFILNDYVELAERLPVDGVHVGENDLPVPEVRKRVGKNLLIGYSSHSLVEAGKAVGDGADYVAFGAIFPTKTKGPGHPVQGLEKLRELVKAISAPLVAIGGITRNNIDAVLQTGVASVAMITALTQAPDVTEATRWFVEKLKKR
ncbi:MAG: thiamine phosphate synthase [bacterium]